MTAPKTPEPAESRPAAAPAAAAPAAPPAPIAAPAPVPAKAVPPAPRPVVAPASSGGGGAFVLAVVALLVAIGAVGIGVYALKVARDAVSKTAQAAPITSTTPTTTPITEPASAPTATATSTASSLATAPRQQYFAELVRVEVNVPAPTGCNSSYVDVDTMQIGVAAGHEFYLSLCVNKDVSELRVDRTSGASTSTSNPSPEVCAALITGTQTSQELVLAAKSGLTFCLLTNKSDATAQSLPQRLAIVEVRNVGADHSVTIAVSTYRLG